MFKKICIGMCCVIITCLMVGCGINPGSPICLFITEDYYDKFCAFEFTIEDFGLDDIKEFSYWHVPDSDSESSRCIRIEINNASKKNLREAAAHLRELEFVRTIVVYQLTSVYVRL